MDQASDSADDHEVRLLRWCLDGRRFELDTALSWQRDPQFWVDRQCYGVLAQMAAGNLRDRPLPPAWVRAFLANLPGLFDSAMRNLDRQECGQVDLRRAVRHLAASRCLVRQVGDAAGGGCADETARADAAIDGFSAWLAQAIGKGRSLRPMGARVWEAGLWAATGVACGPDELEHALRHQLDRSRREIARTRAPVSGPIPGSAAEISRLIARLPDIFAPRFGGGECLGTLRLAVSDDAVPGVTSASYQNAGSRGGGSAVVFVRPAVYAYRADLELDLAHECFPGHHWQHTAQERGHHGHLLCLRHGNRAFVEGWDAGARGCTPLTRGPLGERPVPHEDGEVLRPGARRPARPRTRQAVRRSDGEPDRDGCLRLGRHPLPRAALLLRSLAGNGADRRLSGAATFAAERGEEEMEAMVAQHGAVDLLGRNSVRNDPSVRRLALSFGLFSVLISVVDKLFGTGYILRMNDRGLGPAEIASF